MIHREDVKTYAIPNNVGPAVIMAALGTPSEVAHREVEAWIGNFGSSNVWLFEGEMTLEQCVAEVSKEGEIDCLAALTEAGPITFNLDDDCRKITVFFEHKNEAGQVEAVCLKVRESL